MAKDTTGKDDDDDDELSTFLASFPNQLHCTPTKFFPRIRVFWSQVERPQGISSSDDAPDVWVIHEKIKTAFSYLYLSSLNGLIQFWAPVETSEGRRLLSTSDQPFALEHLDSGGFFKYRLTSMSYQYRIDQIEVEKDERMIINGPPTTAFLNHLPEVVPNLSVHEGSPLMRSAVECELTFSLMLPVFYRSTSQRPTACVGVVECTMKQSSLILLFNDLKRALERVGLSTFNVQECRPSKSICGLK